MNKYFSSKIFQAIFAVAIIVSLLSFSSNNVNLRTSETGFGDFTKKTYYKEIFSNEEVNKLALINSQISETEIKLKKADKYVKEYLKYKKNLAVTKDPKDKKKFAKKIVKYSKKINKITSKPYSALNGYYTQKYTIYNNKFAGLTFDKSVEHKAAKDTARKAIGIFNKAVSLRKKALSNTDIRKSELQKQAIESQKKSIKIMELAFGLYKKDAELTGAKKEVVNNKDTVKVVPEKKFVYKSNYKPETDKNLYKSKADIIIPKLKINKADKMLLKQLKEKESKTDAIKYDIENDYVKIEYLYNKVGTEKNKILKEKLKNEAANIEMKVFYKQIKTAQTYLSINESRYNIYERNFVNLRPKSESEKRKTGREYEKHARALFSNSKNLVMDAGFKSIKHKKYQRLQDALILRLSAIQEQENAYCTYLGLPVTKAGNNEQIISNPDIADTTNVNNGNGQSDSIITPGNKKKVVVNKSKFIYSGSFVYSVEQQKTAKLKPAKGIVFKIQTGFFKYNLSIADYAKFSPISYDTFKGSPHKRFFVGKYRTSEAADYALAEIRKKYKDAFIVAYKDGKKISSYSLGKKNLVKNSEYKKTKEKEMAILTGKVEDLEVVKIDEKTETQTDKDKNNTKYDDITLSKGIIYSVQIGLFSQPKTNEELKMLAPVFQEKTSKGIKYMVGKYDSYKKANAKKKEVAKSFEKAFITAYKNGKSINLKKAKELTKANVKKSKTEIFFAVQLGAYTLKLTEKEQAMFDKISKKYKIDIRKDKNGLTTYSVGKEKTYEAVKKLKIGLIKDGYKDGFITAYKDGIKISVSKAVKLSKKQGI